MIHSTIRNAALRQHLSIYQWLKATRDYRKKRAPYVGIEHFLEKYENTIPNTGHPAVSGVIA
jgi:hypothetical protein